MAKEVEMLGTGNAFMPYGRYHSFALLDRKHIIDCPPTAMASLRRARVPLSDVETIFITHIHGDHVFGFPFMLLERRYISDRDMAKPLTIVAAEGVKEHLWKLCEMAYPGSLEEIFSTITWRNEVQGTLDCGMTWKRFRVLHDESVDPYGYHFNSGQKGSFVHSGDSGPCQTLYDEIAAASMAIIEMGHPEWVQSDHHHKPSTIQSLAERVHSVQLVVTHTYIDQPGVHTEVTVTDQYPVHPENVHHAEDGLCLTRDGGDWHLGRKRYAL